MRDIRQGPFFVCGRSSIFARNQGYFRGQERPSSWCDYVDASGRTCDALPDHEVRWKPVPEVDVLTEPLSGVCADHVIHVDQVYVRQMTTHPDRSGP